MAIRLGFQYQVKAQPVAPFGNGFAPPNSWFQPLSEPVRVPRRNNLYDEVQPAAPFGNDFAPPESWSYQWSEPVRVPRRNNLYDEVQAPTPFSGDFASLESWSYQWSEPVRVPRRNNLYDEVQPPAPFDNSFAPIESWFSPLGEPIRIPRRNNLYDEAQPAAPFGNSFAPFESWFAPLGEPIRLPRRPTPYEQAEPIQQVAAVAPPTAWFSWLSEPIRVLRRNVLTFEIAEPIPQLAPLTPVSWAQALSEPVRVLPRTAFFDFTTAFQNLSFITPALFLVPAQPTYQPYRPRPPIDDQNLAYFNINLIPQLMPPVYSWKVIAAPPPVQSYTLSLNTTTLNIPEVVTVDKWVYPWSLPVRAKPRAPQFMDAARSPGLVLLSNVLVNLQATERKDTWSMTFSESATPPFTARVGIVERLRDTGQVAMASLDAGNIGVIESDL